MREKGFEGTTIKIGQAFDILEHQNILPVHPLSSTFFKFEF
jgi:hypothetical protein